MVHVPQTHPILPQDGMTWPISASSARPTACVWGGAILPLFIQSLASPACPTFPPHEERATSRVWPGYVVRARDTSWEGNNTAGEASHCRGHQQWPMHLFMRPLLQLCSATLWLRT